MDSKHCSIVRKANCCIFAVRLVGVAVVGCWSLLIASTGIAAAQIRDDKTFDSSWSIGVNTEHTDNYYRVQSDKTAEIYWSAFLQFDLGALGDRWELAGDSDLSYRKFSNTLLGDELNGNFSGSGQYEAIKDYLEFHADDHYGQVKKEQNLPSSDENKVSINALTIGAGLTLPLGKRTEVFSRDDWTKVSIGAAVTDQTRNEVTAGLRQSLSSVTSISASAARSSVEFDSLPAEFDYHIDEYTLGFQADLARTDADISVGKTRVTSFNTSSDGVLVRARLLRLIGTRLTLSLEGGTEFSDSARTFVAQQGLTGVDPLTTNLGIVEDPFKSDFAFVGMAWDGARNDVMAQYSWRRERNVNNSALDVDVSIIRTRVTHEFSSRLDIYLDGTYGRWHRAEIASSLFDARVRLGSRMHVLRRLVLEPYLEHYTGSGSGFNYQDNRVGLSFGYYSR